MHSIFNEGLSYVDKSEHYSYSYKTIRSIARGFQEMSKHMGNVRYPILQDEHI